MDLCRNNCTCFAIIIGIVAGFVLGILSSLGFISTGIIFWVSFVLGFLGVLFSPLYAQGSSCREGDRCFCKYKGLILTAAVGAIVSSVVGLIVAPVSSIIVISIVIGLATMFLTMLLVSLICLSNCLCRNYDD